MDIPVCHLMQLLSVWYLNILQYEIASSRTLFTFFNVYRHNINRAFNYAHSICALICMCKQHDSTVRLHLTTSGRRTQAIPHPRPVSDIIWRHPGTHSGNRNDDPILYTTTTNGTLRVFLSVLDAPQRVQLHTALDAASSIPLSSQLNSLEEEGRALSSSVFALDRDAILTVLKCVENTHSPEEDARSRRIREIAEEGWDLFLRVLADGSFVVQAVAVSHQTHQSLMCRLSTYFHRTSTGALLRCSNSSPYSSRPLVSSHPLLHLTST